VSIGEAAKSVNVAAFFESRKPSNWPGAVKYPAKDDEIPDKLGGCNWERKL
jgi:hypothetical protein